jgi:hypothetical protein
VSRNAPRFGWAYKTHEKIFQGVLTLNRESTLETERSLYNALWANNKQITQTSRRLDENDQESGQHFLHAERYGVTPETLRQMEATKSNFKKQWPFLDSSPGSWFREFLAQAETTVFNPLKLALSPQIQTNAKLTANALARPSAAAGEPAQESEAPGNVFQSTLLAYNDLKTFFQRYQQRLNEGRRLTEEERKVLLQTFTENVARLEHFASDANQPLHNTLFYQSRIPNDPKRRTSHQEFETTGMIDKWDTANTWLNALPRSVPNRDKKEMDDRDIPAFLASKMYQAYQQFGMMAQLQDGIPRATYKNPDAYIEELTNRWLPIGEAQVTAAAVTVNRLILTAWETAGKPNLKQLCPQPSNRTTDSVCLSRAGRKR